MVMSMDAAALFPSLHLDDILKGVWRLIQDTDLDLETFDYKEMGKYLYVNYTSEELRKNCVISCIPERQVVLDGQAGGHPTIVYLDTDEYKITLNGKTDKNIPKWV